MAWVYISPSWYFTEKGKNMGQDFLWQHQNPFRAYFWNILHILLINSAGIHQNWYRSKWHRNQNLAIEVQISWPQLSLNLSQPFPPLPPEENPSFMWQSTSCTNSTNCHKPYSCLTCNLCRGERQKKKKRYFIRTSNFTLIWLLL